MKTGMRPIYWRVYISVFDRIVVDVIEVLFKIIFIPNLVFPKPSLPDTLLSFF